MKASLGSTCLMWMLLLFCLLSSQCRFSGVQLQSVLAYPQEWIFTGWWHQVFSIFSFLIWIFHTDWRMTWVPRMPLVGWAFPLLHFLWPLGSRSWACKSAPSPCQRKGRQKRGLMVRYIFLLENGNGTQFSAITLVSPPVVRARVLFVEQKKIRSLWTMDWKCIWFINEKTEGGVLIQKFCSVQWKKRKWHGISASCDLKAIVKKTMQCKKVLHIRTYIIASHFFIFLDIFIARNKIY